MDAVLRCGPAVRTVEKAPPVGAVGAFFVSGLAVLCRPLLFESLTASNPASQKIGLQAFDLQAFFCSKYA
jgi:hypothetical protein